MFEVETLAIFSKNFGEGAANGAKNSAIKGDNNANMAKEISTGLSTAAATRKPKAKAATTPSLK